MKMIHAVWNFENDSAGFIASILEFEGDFKVNNEKIEIDIKIVTNIRNRSFFLWTKLVDVFCEKHKLFWNQKLVDVFQK